jgi:surface antigen
MRAVRIIALGCAIALGVSACASNREGGMLAGAAAGAAAGSAVGSGDGKIAAIVIGALIGAIAGGAIGDMLDEADRRKKEAAGRAAASEEGPVVWRSDKDPGTYGRAEQVPAPKVPETGAIPGADSAANDNKTCRTVREIIVIKGKETKEETRYCLVDGAWKAG